MRYRLRQALNRPYRNPWAGYDSWKTSPPEDPAWLRIDVVCGECNWVGKVEDCIDGDLSSNTHCPMCEEFLGSIDDHIERAGEGWD